MGDLWNKRREKLEQAVKDAVMELFEHMGRAAAFRLDLGSGLQVLAGPDDESWPTINTAPKDGARILVCGGTFDVGDHEGLPLDEPVIAHWHGDHWHGPEANSHDEWCRCNPTHWMHIPAPPAKGESKNG